MQSRRDFLKGAMGMAAGVAAGSALWVETAASQHANDEADGAAEPDLPEVPRRAARATVMTRNGMVASAHPIASQIGVRVLQQGGNAMDASVAMAAVLNVLDPAMTGIGGDAFFLYYSARDRELHALNASGRSPHAASIEAYRERGLDEVPAVGPLAVTVPGALHGWDHGLRRFGSASLGELLQPAIQYAEEGFPVYRLLNLFYRIRGQEVLSRFPESVATYLPGGKIPDVGDVLVQQDLARTFKLIAREGSSVLYEGELGDKLVASVREHGGLLTRKDLESHRSDWVDPIAASYGDLTVYELPPNTQGIALLQQLNVLDGLSLSDVHPEHPAKLHLQIETAKLAFADLARYVTDPEYAEVPVTELLSEDYAAQRRALIDPDKSAEAVNAGTLDMENTTYIAVVDKDGNVSSFINSLRNPFGSGLVVEGTGILLQNRGKDFSLDPDSVNRLEPSKRTMHTLNPVIVFKDDAPYMTIGCVGGHQQTQGLQQVLINHADYGFDIQQAIEAPRWSLSPSGTVHIEPELLPAKPGLEARGHEVVVGKTFFGGCQAVVIDPANGVRSGGSDPRVDGAASGY